MSTERYYLLDNDNDGLVNIIEYYGGVNFFNTSVGTSHRERRSLLSDDIANAGTDPTDPDTDDDLLLDGYEYQHGMSPKRADNSSADADGDGLTNLKEQILGTDPLNPDTDGDGVDDGTEVKNMADPNDPSDQGQTPSDQSFAQVRLTIGDHSGSHSERYFLKVGEFKHQSLDFGKVGSGVYTYLPGTYVITVHHIDSIYDVPDFDYIAKVEKQGGDATIQVSDPEGILGEHFESLNDYTLGKSATLVVKGTEKSVSCPSFKTCKECNKQVKCEWRIQRRSCVISHSTVKPPCSCTKCLSWYIKEKKDTRWLKKVNGHFKCPCKAQLVLVNNNAKNAMMKEVDNPSNVKWNPDTSCTNPSSGGCAEYHPGSAGCLRSEGFTNDNAGQQCCYGSDGELLPAGSKGAGTPDKHHYNSREIFGHLEADIEPYNDCCRNCEIDYYCNYYINDVRKGDDSHCQK